MATTYKWAIKTSNKLEQAAKLIRVYCVLNNISPSDTSILICAYVMIYGLNDKVKEDIIKAGIIGKPGSLENEIYALRRMGLLEGVRGNTRISGKIVPFGIQGLTPQTLLLVNLDNR